MHIAIIDCGSGNLRSVAKAFEYAAARADIEAKIAITADPSVVEQADRLVLPGVGAFAACMRGLQAIKGLLPALENSVLEKKRPFYGICVGMQILADEGHEFEITRGLGWIEGVVEKLPQADPSYKIPHMGWNSLTLCQPHPCFQDAPSIDEDVYFVHSYSFRAKNEKSVLAKTHHGNPVVAAIGRDNIVGVQFHPEKSQAAGLAMIERFLHWQPADQAKPKEVTC